MTKLVLPIEEALATYHREAQRPATETAEQERQQILERFPFDAWPAMPRGVDHEPG
ncbi:MAG: hypothetical protein JXA14_08210 [Anaerolineae bacterium]|nr:hypothetical protein [Anaerolineae bacterium]